jgi:hypothetical protein
LIVSQPLHSNRAITPAITLKAAVKGVNRPKARRREEQPDTAAARSEFRDCQ